MHLWWHCLLFQNRPVLTMYPLFANTHYLSSPLLTILVFPKQTNRPINVFFFKFSFHHQRHLKFNRHSNLPLNDESNCICNKLITVCNVRTSIFNYIRTYACVCVCSCNFRSPFVILICERAVATPKFHQR